MSLEVTSPLGMIQHPGHRKVKEFAALRNVARSMSSLRQGHRLVPVRRLRAQEVQGPIIHLQASVVSSEVCQAFGLGRKRASKPREPVGTDLVPRDEPQAPGLGVQVRDHVDSAAIGPRRDPKCCQALRGLAPRSIEGFGGDLRGGQREEVLVAGDVVSCCLPLPDIAMRRRGAKAPEARIDEAMHRPRAPRAVPQLHRQEILVPSRLRLLVNERVVKLYWLHVLQGKLSVPEGH
mmetsp:Transcript_54135/g.116913  ORF Transcript_54135/g.116913 Transcript_54135/m.116913 type:complete len:235 (+) Transcript_54135:596-1300(+)